jgi:hypothetical protein
MQTGHGCIAELIVLGSGEIAQLVTRAWVQQVKRVVFQRRVDAGTPCEGAAMFRERSVPYLSNPLLGVQFALEISLQFILKICGGATKHEIEPRSGEWEDHEHYSDKKLRPEARRPAAARSPRFEKRIHRISICGIDLSFITTYGITLANGLMV